MLNELLRPIPEEDLNRFHGQVLHLVETFGLQIPHEGMLKRLSGFDGVRIDGDIVTFRPDLVDEHVFDIEFDVPPYFGGDEFVIISGNMNPTIRDAATGQIRPATAADLVRATKLEDSYDVVGSAPVTPNDVPKHLAEICMHKILWENSRFKGNDIFEHNPRSTVRCCAYVREMAQVLGKFFNVGFWIQSPRTCNRYELDVVYRYLDEDVPLWVGNFPMYGVTSPLYIETGMAQAAAELFAGYLALKLLHGDRPVYLQVIDSVMGHPVDWRYMNPLFSSVEDILKTIYQVSINCYYHIPLVGMSLLAAGKEPDFQQGFEKAIHTLLCVQLGVRAFRIAGYLALDMVYSLEQLVCDCEMMRFIKELTRRRPFDCDKILVDEVARGQPGGSYLGDELTIKHFREEYWDPGFFDRAPVNTWLAEGGRSLEQRARDIVEKRVASHDYRLPEEQQREIDHIYERAAHDEALEASYRHL
jgi:trimethylamine--corrinoid protein Co-methyltransferase